MTCAVLRPEDFKRSTWAHSIFVRWGNCRSFPSKQVTRDASFGLPRTLDAAWLLITGSAGGGVRMARVRAGLWRKPTRRFNGGGAPAAGGAIPAPKPDRARVVI